MGGGDWKDCGYRGILGRTEDIEDFPHARRSRRSADSCVPNQRACSASLGSEEAHPGFLEFVSCVFERLDAVLMLGCC